MSASPEYTHFVGLFYQEIDSLLKDYVYGGYHALAHFIEKPLALIATLYIVIFGFCLMKGWMRVGFGTFTRAVLKIGLIYTVAMNWDWVSAYIFDGINGTIDGVSGALLESSPIHVGHYDTIKEALQGALTQFTDISRLFQRSGGWFNISALFEGWLIYIAGYLMVAIALLEISLAKIMLSILMVLLPVFVCFCFFETTKAWFDRYVGAIASQAFLLILINAVLALGLQLTYWAMPVLAGVSALSFGIAGVAPLLIITVIVLVILSRVKGFAYDLAGSIASVSQSGGVGAMVGGVLSSKDTVKESVTRASSSLQNSASLESDVQSQLRNQD